MIKIFLRDKNREKLHLRNFARLIYFEIPCKDCIDGDSPLTVIFSPHFRLPIYSFVITSSQDSILSCILLVYDGYISCYLGFQKNIAALLILKIFFPGGLEKSFCKCIRVKDKNYKIYYILIM